MKGERIKEEGCKKQRASGPESCSKPPDSTCDNADEDRMMMVGIISKRMRLLLSCVVLNDWCFLHLIVVEWHITLHNEDWISRPS